MKIAMRSVISWTDYDAILVRSASLHEMEFPASLKCIARAGAGVNNIPLQRCSEAGIVVFNTPGANANAVKELTIAGLLLASRKIVKGIEWVKTLERGGCRKGGGKGEEPVCRTGDHGKEARCHRTGRDRRAGGECSRCLGHGCLWI